MLRPMKRWRVLVFGNPLPILFKRRADANLTRHDLLKVGYADSAIEVSLVHVEGPSAPSVAAGANEILGGES